MNILILIPTYNSIYSLKNLLHSLTKFHPKEDILIINDGSTDHTAGYLREHHFTTISYKPNQGKGYALRKGFQYFLANTDKDALITMDADLQHPPDHILKLQDYMEKNKFDMVIGNRMKQISGMPLHRIASNSLSSLAVSLITLRYIPDSQCGFRLIKRWLIESVYLTTSRFDTETEFIIESLRHKAKVGFMEIPTIYNYPGGSAFDNLTDTIRFLRLICRYLTGIR
ncbi:glycosyltransferase family 2 protein [bacterium]|nr:glycosyltransferase family 2 protein [bacterium]